jgi:hypothetical protein
MAIAPVEPRAANIIHLDGGFVAAEYCRAGAVIARLGK